MKKTLIISAAAATIGLCASAQAIESPSFGDNWYLGFDGGVTTPLTHHPFFKSMKPVVGVSLEKKLTPTFAIGAEGQFAINTSKWKGRIPSKTAFDDSYVGLYGAVDLFNLFGGYPGYVRPFNIEAVAGAGWGHVYLQAPNRDHNYFATKAGLNFNFNVSDVVTLAVSPSVYWDMSDAGVAHTSAAYNANKATFNITAGVKVRLGGNGFQVVTPYNQAEVDALNGQVNDLRAQLDNALESDAAWQAKADALAAELKACQEKPATVVKEVQVDNQYNSVRFVFYRIGSSTITADQKPNVEMIADYMKHHPEATVVVKGYASKDGNLDFNIKLAQKRAESVKNMLVNVYKIKADRIKAEGEGIGNMFEEESWNRVSICTIEEAQ